MTLKVTLLLTSVLFHSSVSTLIVDPNSYQYQVGNLVPDNGYISYPEVNPLMYQVNPEIQEMPQIPEQRSIRQPLPNPPKVPMDTSLVTNNLNSEINEIIESLNRLTENRMTENQERAAERDDFGLYHRASNPGYPGSPPSYGPWSPPYGPPPHKHEHSAKLSLLKPDLFVKPVATKAASKISGLIELGLAFLGSSGGLELKGFKDIVINGIVKPLLLAKGGLKSLISKLSIPVIALLLINLEVLITIWWLWEEDCPKPVYHHPTYAYPAKPTYHEPSYPPNYNYSPY